MFVQSDLIGKVVGYIPNIPWFKWLGVLVIPIPGSLGVLSHGVRGVHECCHRTAGITVYPDLLFTARPKTRSSISAIRYATREAFGKTFWNIIEWARYADHCERCFQTQVQEVERWLRASDSRVLPWTRMWMPGCKWFIPKAESGSFNPQYHDRGGVGVGCLHKPLQLFPK